ncbi:MAG: UPF0182 family protein [Chloroflexota bacterium]
MKLPFGWGRKFTQPPYESIPGGGVPAFSSRWLLIAAIIGLAFIVLNLVRSAYTDYLWFDNVEYASVYIKMVSAQALLFAVGAVVAGVLIWANLWLAHRQSVGPAAPEVPVEMAATLRRMLTAGILLGSVALAVIFGSVATGEWGALLRFKEQVPFGKTDPLFNQDIGFYVFSLPLYHFVQSWLLWALAVTLAAVLGVYFLNFSIRGMGFQLRRAVKAHLLVLGAAVMLVLVFSYWLDTYGLVFSPRGAIFGATFTDVSTQLPALRVLMVIGLATAVTFIVGALFIRETKDHHLHTL